MLQKNFGMSVSRQSLIIASLQFRHILENTRQKKCNKSDWIVAGGGSKLDTTQMSINNKVTK